MQGDEAKLEARCRMPQDTTGKTRKGGPAVSALLSVRSNEKLLVHCIFECFTS